MMNLKILNRLKVSDQKFASLYRENTNLIKKATSKFNGSLSEDEKIECGLFGLVECLVKHDDKLGSKFSTSLYMHVNRMCIRYISTRNKIERKHRHLDIETVVLKCCRLNQEVLAKDILGTLNKSDRKLLEQRYIFGKTLAELAFELEISKMTVKNRIDNILYGLRNKLGV